MIINNYCINIMLANKKLKLQLDKHLAGYIPDIFYLEIWHFASHRHTNSNKYRSGVFFLEQLCCKKKQCTKCFVECRKAGQTGKEASMAAVGKETWEWGSRIIGQKPGEAQRAVPGSVRVFSG